MIFKISFRIDFSQVVGNMPSNAITTLLEAFLIDILVVGIVQLASDAILRKGFDELIFDAITGFTVINRIVGFYRFVFSRRSTNGRVFGCFGFIIRTACRQYG